MNIDQEKQRLNPHRGRIIETAIVHCDGIMRIMREFEVEFNVLEDFLLDHGVERCPECDLYFLSYDFVDDVCKDCYYEDADNEGGFQ